MRFGGAVLICLAVQPHMGTNAIPSKEHLHCIPGDAHIHLLANVLIRDGIIHFLHRDVIVRTNRGDLPRRQLERTERQRLEKRLLILKQKRPAAVLRNLLYIIHFLISKLDTTYEVIKKDPRRVP